MTEKIRTIRISNNVLFVLAIILIGINSYTFMIASKEQVTGKALEQVGTTRICIGTTPYLSDLTPYFYIVVNGTYNTSVNGTGTDYVDFFYYYFGIGEQFFARDNDTDADGVYNATLNTTELPDGNCNYRIIARAYEVCGIAAAIGSATFTVNNNDTEPVWDEFNNSLSTNFSNYTSWTSIPGARIGIPGYGTIDFTTFNFDAANLNNMFNISYNNISFDLDTTTYACFFDQIYLIKFFNVTQFAEPVVLRNGELCDLYCFNLNYSEGNYSFYTRVPGDYWYTIAEGGNLSANFTFTFPNKTYDNSPTVNITTYIHGSVRDVPITAECYYKTDYDPSTFTLMNITGTINHSQRLPEQNWSYIPTNMGHYPEIQHHDYYSGEHLLTVNCTALYDGVPDYTKTAMVNTTFYITYTDRDRVYYADGDEVKMYLELEEPNLNISVDLSQIDSNFDPANVTVTNNSLEYNISYNISSANTRSDGQYNVTIEAINETGHETMNGSIFMHLKNDWYESDIDDAFDCWTWRPGYYFDEVGCDWDADVVRAFKRVLDPLYIEVDCFDGLDNEGDCVTDTNGDCPGDTNLDGFVCGPGDVGVCTCNQSATPTCDENVDFMDKDCLGLFYSIRRDAEIASAFMADPCINNICFMCLGTDNNGDGTCDYPDGVNVQYLNSVRPGAPLRVKFNRSSIVGES
ncbi:hypothetical protein KY359_03035, partial [Candidatus Woesearchaeota archaeon]|nr:hypothetical protein [Candidatus Woesearchaeota archaeon]